MNGDKETVEIMKTDWFLFVSRLSTQRDRLKSMFSKEEIAELKKAFYRGYIACFERITGDDKDTYFIKQEVRKYKKDHGK